MQRREVAERIRKARHYLEPILMYKNADTQMNKILNELTQVQVRMESEAIDTSRTK